MRQSFLLPAPCYLAPLPLFWTPSSQICGIAAGQPSFAAALLMIFIFI